METLSSLRLRTGGMSLKEAGVEATSPLCSSGDTYVGIAEIGVTAGIL